MSSPEETPQMHGCPCGHNWFSGQDPAHDCGWYYNSTINALREVIDEKIERIKELEHELQTPKGPTSV